MKIGNKKGYAYDRGTDDGIRGCQASGECKTGGEVKMAKQRFN